MKELSLDEKIAKATITMKKQEKRKKRLKNGKFRNQTITERCGVLTIGWVMFLSISAGSSWTYVYEHRNELLAPQTITITPIHEAKASVVEKEDKAPESEEQGQKEGEFSAYNAEVGQTDNDPFTMASGKRVYEGAVANNCLSFGSKIKVNGKTKIVEDRMNSRYGCDHFDIFMESKGEALKFGRKNLNYEIL